MQKVITKKEINEAYKRIMKGDVRYWNRINKATLVGLREIINPPTGGQVKNVE